MTKRWVFCPVMRDMYSTNYDRSYFRVQRCYGPSSEQLEGSKNFIRIPYVTKGFGVSCDTLCRGLSVLKFGVLMLNYNYILYLLSYRPTKKPFSYYVAMVSRCNHGDLWGSCLVLDVWRSSDCCCVVVINDDFTVTRGHTDLILLRVQDGDSNLLRFRYSVIYFG